MTPHISRRRALELVGVMGFSTLAGCNDGGDNGTETPAQTPTRTETPDENTPTSESSNSVVSFSDQLIDGEKIQIGRVESGPRTTLVVKNASGNQLSESVTFEAGESEEVVVELELDPPLEENTEATAQLIDEDGNVVAQETAFLEITGVSIEFVGQPSAGDTEVQINAEIPTGFSTGTGSDPSIMIFDSAEAPAYENRLEDVEDSSSFLQPGHSGVVTIDLRESLEGGQTITASIVEGYVVTSETITVE